jgi:hypothetical protein
VAEIIDLGTGRAAGRFAFAAIEPDVTSAVSSPGLRGDKVTDEAGKGLRHLIGKRHHAS